MIGRIEEVIRESTFTDEELVEIARRAVPRVAIVGVGGAGCNAVDMLKDRVPKEVKRIAINTDSQKLLKIDADEKILIGESLLGGLSTGRDRELGKKALLENALDVEDALRDFDIIFIVAGVGGGTGGGATPEVARIAWEMKKKVVVMAIFPFAAEGTKTRENAVASIGEIRKYANTIILSENDKLLEILGNIPFEQAFMAITDLLAMGIRSVIEALSMPTVVNVNLSDLVELLSRGGLATMGVGESSGEDRAREAVKRAISNPFFELSPPYGGAFVMAWSAETPAVFEINEMFEELRNILSEDSILVWGAGSDPELKDRLRVFLLLAGGSYHLL